MGKGQRLGRRGGAERKTTKRLKMKEVKLVAKKGGVQGEIPIGGGRKKGFGK